MSAPSTSHVVEPAPRERRSLFGNYAAGRSEPAAHSAPAEVTPLRRDASDVVAARCFLAQFLARAFEHPSASTWAWVTDAGTREALLAAAALLTVEPEAVVQAAAEVACVCRSEAFGSYHDDYVTAIGHAARGSCPINEIEYGELKADPLLQPHRLADLAALYRAFGMELTEEGGERQDHLAVELEFLAVLAGQEAHALADDLPDEVLAVNLEAQRLFLREHLGRWSPTFARRLETTVSDGALRAVARLLLAFVLAECRRAGVNAGGVDVTLRPADEEAALCDSCGLRTPLPGGAAGSEPA